jgi:hypothetical protein
MTPERKPKKRVKKAPSYGFTITYATPENPIIVSFD